jgi:hypothetical protein
VAAGTVTVTNTIFGCNIITCGSCGRSVAGGGIFVDGGSVTVVNSTIARNATSLLPEASLDATGLYLNTGTLNVANSIVFFNNGDGTQIGPTFSHAILKTADLLPRLDAAGSA